MADDLPVQSIIEVAAAGERVPTLESLRQVLALSILEADPPNRASLAKQLREVLAELDDLSAGVEVSKSDDLAARRTARIAAKVPSPTGKGRQRRSGSD